MWLVFHAKLIEFATAGFKGLLIARKTCDRLERLRPSEIRRDAIVKQIIQADASSGGLIVLLVVLTVEKIFVNDFTPVMTDT